MLLSVRDVVCCNVGSGELMKKLLSFVQAFAFIGNSPASFGFAVRWMGVICISDKRTNRQADKNETDRQTDRQNYVDFLLARTVVLLIAYSYLINRPT